jgi:hypothetical protein
MSEVGAATEAFGWDRKHSSSADEVPVNGNLLAFSYPLFIVADAGSLGSRIGTPVEASKGRIGSEARQ